MKRVIVILVVFVVLAFVFWGCEERVDSSRISNEIAEKQVYELMDEQLTGWNSGSHVAFMDGYWKSDSLQFITRHGVRKGWENVLEKYKKSFPKRDDMCCLTFDDRQFTRWSDSICQVTGRWHIERTDSSESEGNYSLWFKMINSQWFIVVDHTW